jgi:hypothetical protein
MFESAPKKKRVNSDRDIDARLAGYLEELHSTQDEWFRQGSFQNINDRIHLISRALDETRKILYIEHGHEWGERERYASTVSLALSEEFNYLSTLKEGFAQKKEMEKQKELPSYRMAGAHNPYPTEEPKQQRTAAKVAPWDFLK